MTFLVDHVTGGEGSGDVVLGLAEAV